MYNHYYSRSSRQRAIARLIEEIRLIGGAKIALFTEILGELSARLCCSVSELNQIIRQAEDRELIDVRDGGSVVILALRDHADSPLDELEPPELECGPLRLARRSR